MGKTYRVSGLTIGKQAGTDRTYYAQWHKLSGKIKAGTLNSLTKEYAYIWEYQAGNVWFEGSTGSVDPPPSDVSIMTCTYSAPDNADKVRVRVKPISKTYKKSKKDVKRYESTWTGWASTNTPSSVTKTPETPSAPDVKIDKQKLTATIESYDVNTTSMVFEVVSNDHRYSSVIGPVPLDNNRAILVLENLITGLG